MSYFPPGTPGPEPTLDDTAFWDYCARHELRFQRCVGCGRFRLPPMPACPHCRSLEHEWVRAPETGEVFSFTVVYHAAVPEIAAALPYNIAIVAFPECDGVRLVSNVMDASAEEMRIGMRVRLAWDTAGNGRTVPRFRKA